MYVLERISVQDQEIILSDLPGQERRIAIARGHFAKQPDLSWAVDRERGTYLLLAPKLEIMAPVNRYYFRFNGVIYVVNVTAPFGPTVSFEKTSRPDVEEMPEIRENLRRAFAIYGISGAGDEDLVLAEFDRDI